MMKLEENKTVSTSNGDWDTIYGIEHPTPPRADVALDKDELSNVIEFIELNFIESVRNDTDIDNIDYIISMMSALQKFRDAYASIKRRRGRYTINQEASNEDYKKS